MMNLLDGGEGVTSSQYVSKPQVVVWDTKNQVKSAFARFDDSDTAFSDGRPATGTSREAITATAVRNPTDRATFEGVVKRALGRPSNWRLHIYDTAADAIADGVDPKKLQGYSETRSKTLRTMGWVDTRQGVRHATFILEHVPAGRELSVFMHEVGTHLGLESVVPAAQQRRLARQVQQWSTADNDSVEAAAAKGALRRVEQAQVPPEKVNREVVAYFIEEAVHRGVDPTALQDQKGSLARWFQTVWQAFQRAMRKLGLKSEQLSAQEFVDLALGAAHIELADPETVEMRGDESISFGMAAAIDRFSNAFDRWFAGSQVVDEDGEPLVLYHGTRADFDSFRGNGPWPHFGPLNQANTRLEHIAEDTAAGQAYPEDSHVMPVYLSIKNPLTLPDVGRWHNAGAMARTLITTLKGLGDNRSAAKLEQLAQDYDPNQRGYRTDMTAHNNEFVDKVRDVIEEAGYDGFVYPNRVEGLGEDSWVPLRPTQVKSATGNAGTYDPENPDIRYSDTVFSEAEEDAVEQTARRSVSDKAQAAVEANINKLPEDYRPPVRALTDTVRSAVQKTYIGLAFLKDLGDIVIKRVPALEPHVRRLMQAITDTKVERVKREKVVTEVLDRTYNLQGKKDERKAINLFLMDSRLKKAWGYAPPWKLNAVVDPAMKKRFERFSPEAQQVIRDMHRIMHDDYREIQDLINRRITDTFAARLAQAKNAEERKEIEADREAAVKAFGKTLVELEGPYMPLKRQGAFVVQAYSPEMGQARDAEDWKKVEQLRADPKHYALEFAESRWEAARRVQELGKEFTHTDSWEKAQWRENPVVGLHEVDRLRSYIAGMADDGSERAKQLLNMAEDLALQVMTESHARQAAQHSRDIRGADQDMIRSFVVQGRANAHYIANLKHLSATNDAVNNIAGFVENPKGRMAAGVNRDELTRLVNGLYWHWGKSMDYRPTPVSDRLAAVSSAWYLLFSPAYYLQNMTQVGMMSVPYMAGRFGYATTQREVLRAYRDVKDMVTSAGAFEHFDTSKVPEDVRHVVERLLDSGAINITMDLELGQVADTGEGPLSQGQRIFDRTVRRLPAKVETLNRVVTGIAAYRLGTQQPDAKYGGKRMAEDHAINYARKVIDVTHGDYDGVNTPKFISPKFIPGAKALFQFRKFQLIQLFYLARLVDDALSGESADVRHVARMSLLYTLGHYAALAGGLGLPGMAFMQSALGVAGSLFGDDDEPWDKDAQVLRFRKAADNIGLSPEITDVVLNGLPTLFDMNLTSRLGAQNVVSLLPYIRADVRDYDSYDKLLAGALGPSASLGKKVVWGGMSRVAEGDYYRAMEQVLPNGLRSALTAGRLAVEGDTTYNGDQVLTPEEIGLWNVLQAGVGLSAPSQQRRFERQRQLQSYEDHYSRRTSDLKKAFTEARREGDRAAERRLRKEWKELQDAKEEAGFRRTPRRRSPRSVFRLLPGDHHAQDQVPGQVFHRVVARVLAALGQAAELVVDAHVDLC